MGKVNVVAQGHTPWRDRAEAYDYSQLDDKLSEAAVYIITNPPSAWNFSAEAWSMYEQIYGAEAKAKAQKTALVAENTDATWVIGTQGNTTEKAVALKAAGKIFGYDPIAVTPVDHTGMIYIKTLFGYTWVKADNLYVSQLKADQLLDNIRNIIKEELESIVSGGF